MQQLIGGKSDYDSVESDSMSTEYYIRKLDGDSALPVRKDPQQRECK